MVANHTVIVLTNRIHAKLAESGGNSYHAHDVEMSTTAIYSELFLSTVTDVRVVHYSAGLILTQFCKYTRCEIKDKATHKFVCRTPEEIERA